MYAQRTHALDAGIEMSWTFASLLALFVCCSLMVLESLVQGWWYCRHTRASYKGLPPTLPFSLLRKALLGSWSNPPTIQNCFDSAETWFDRKKDRTWSLELIPGLCLRRFILVANEALLTHVLVSKNSRYTKHHAHGILERFRQTTLPSSGLDAWKEVHRLISKFGRGLPELQAVLTPILDAWIVDNVGGCERNGTTNGHGHEGLSNGYHSNPIPDSAETLRKLYWKIVMIMVLNDSSEEAAEEYAQAWTTCMARLDSSAAFLFWFAQYIPTPLNIRYAIQTRRLRKRVRRAVDMAWESSAESQPCKWSFLGMLQSEPSNSSHRLSKEDTAEVLLEVLFTGASSVTTTLLWLLWHLATHRKAQEKVYDELSTVPHDNFLASASSLKLPFLDACIRETLRLYSPIHVGRRCVQDDHFEGIDIPAGTDIAANMWFIHRDANNWTDPHEFRPERFLNKPNNVPFYHPFSMGLRGCPGRVVAYAMIKYFVARVLTKYELSPSPNMPAPHFDGSVVLSNTPTGVYLSATKRGTD